MYEIFYIDDCRHLRKVVVNSLQNISFGVWNFVVAVYERQNLILGSQLDGLSNNERFFYGHVDLYKNDFYFDNLVLQSETRSLINLNVASFGSSLQFNAGYLGAFTNINFVEVATDRYLALIKINGVFGRRLVWLNKVIDPETVFNGSGIVYNYIISNHLMPQNYKSVTIKGESDTNINFSFTDIYNNVELLKFPEPISEIEFYLSGGVGASEILQNVPKTFEFTANTCIGVFVTGTNMSINIAGKLFSDVLIS